VQLVLGPQQVSDGCLRLYGHPGLLAVAAAVNGPDFTPFNEAIWIKHPRLGGSVAWHQDGFTHWARPDLDGGTHGFNFMAQLYGSNAANGLWVVPGSHLGGRADIPAMVAAAGSERLPDAVPLLCGPGDVAMTSRQAVHGSFANTSPDVRVTFNLGFHRRASVLGVRTSGVYGRSAVYDDARIRERSRAIAWAIAARAARFPDEGPFRYEPFAGEDPGPPALAGYHLLDLAI
jgi:ectoine hydroxylase-related dioxygenase (phytanoyl-CoA dioxygenase family)